MEGSMTDDPFAQIVDGLYAGTLDDAAWGRALVGIADAVRASGAILLAFNPQTGAVLREENHRFCPDTAEGYRKHWSSRDCRLEHCLPLPVGQPVTETLLQMPGWNRTPILNEFLRPADAPHFMPAWLHKAPSKAVTLSLQGTRKRGPFESTDLETFRRVLPHVRRALEIRDRLQNAQVRADSLAECLNGLSFGVLVLDDDGKLLEGNGVADKILRSDDGVSRRPDGTLTLNDPGGSEFARWIKSGEPPRSGDGLFHSRRHGALPLSILLTPLPRQGTAWISRDPRWLVLIFDPEQRVEASLETIARDLGVSSSEARVAGLVAAGYSLCEIAKRLRVSEHTVRAQLKAVFRKTGTGTQANLVRRIALGPATIRWPARI